MTSTRVRKDRLNRRSQRSQRSHDRIEPHPYVPSTIGYWLLAIGYWLLAMREARVREARMREARFEINSK
jgi:hypothetical protein